MWVDNINVKMNNLTPADEEMQNHNYNWWYDVL